MFDRLKAFSDRWLGRGSAAITVPVMDGALKSNRVLDNASVLAELPGIDDLAWDGQTVWASAGPALYRLGEGGLAEVHRFDQDISGFAFSRHGRLAVALGGQRVLVLAMADGRPGGPQASLERLGGQPLVSVNALAWDGEEALLFTDGSRTHGPAQWSHDLMTLGRSGRAARWWLKSGEAELLADGLQHAFGVLPLGPAGSTGSGHGALVSESWGHRVLLRGQASASPLVAELPGYPSRMAPAADGGFWLSCFVCRSQLVEFVLREPGYRRRMVAEIAPQHWIAPALSSGHSFLEPLQGAGVKNMGVLKPWAPPRSYGLVLQISANGRVRRSFHSQVDGKHHGITAITEHNGRLYAASKGSGRLLCVDLHALEGGVA